MNFRFQNSVDCLVLSVLVVFALAGCNGNTQDKILLLSSGSARHAITSTATRVYGQGGFYTTNTWGTSATSTAGTFGVAINSSGVYISDQSNNRVLYYEGASTTATRVYGQGGSFTTNTANNGGISATSLSNPLGVAVDSTGVYIADYNNNRVLYYSGASTTATRVYGQGGSFITDTENKGGISATSLNRPVSIAVGSTGIYIADHHNNRVLYYDGESTTATRVYGQGGNFTTNTANNGGISASSLNLPECVAVDANGVYIAEWGNDRVMYYEGESTTAKRVYGQGGSFTTGTANNGGVSADSLSDPTGIAVDSTGGLYISDRSNNRVLYYTGTSTRAKRVYGQGGSFTTDTANNGGVSADSLSDPAGIAVDSTGGLYISDRANRRVLYY